MRGRDDFKIYYHKIYNEIKALGYEHLDHEIINFDRDHYYEKLEKEGRKGYVELYQKKMQYLHEADICVFECSLHSLSIGFIIQRALDFNKPTVVLYYKENLPHFLMGAQEEKLMIRSYNEQNMKKVLKEILKDAWERKDKRFNFFITPKMLNYLEKASKAEGVTKSKFIRSLIFWYMKNHPLI